MRTKLTTGLLRLAFPRAWRKQHTGSHSWLKLSGEILTCTVVNTSFILDKASGKNRQLSATFLVFREQYLHVLHGHNVHLTLGSSLYQFGAESIHDDDGFENWSLAFLPDLQECFRFTLTVAEHHGNVSWKKEC